MGRDGEDDEPEPLLCGGDGADVPEQDPVTEQTDGGDQPERERAEQEDDERPRVVDEQERHGRVGREHALPGTETDPGEQVDPPLGDGDPADRPQGEENDREEDVRPVFAGGDPKPLEGHTAPEGGAGDKRRSFGRGGPDERVPTH